MRRLAIALALCGAACPTPAQPAGSESVSFPSAEPAKAQINGLLFAAKGTPVKAVIGLHGCNGLFEDGPPVEHYVSWGETLSAAGFTVVLIDSLRSRGIESLCAARGPAPITYEQMVGDVYGALSFLQKRSGPSISVAVLGWSMGGDVVLRAVSEQSTAAYSQAGRLRAAIVFYPSCAGLARRGWKAASPMLFQLGAADESTPPKPCVDLAERARALGAAIDLDLYGGAHHLFDHPNMEVHPFTRLVRPDGSSPMLGTDPKARKESIERVKLFLGSHL